MNIWTSKRRISFVIQVSGWLDQSLEIIANVELLFQSPAMPQVEKNSKQERTQTGRQHLDYEALY